MLAWILQQHSKVLRELALPAALAYPLGCVELVLANEPVKMFRNSPLGGFRSNFSIPLPELIYWLQHS
jgi:hypothetical protein